MVLLNLVLSLLDIAALLFLLAIVGWYTESGKEASGWFNYFSDKYPLYPILLLILFFGFKSLIGYLVFKRQSTFFFSVSSRLSREKLINYLSSTYTDYVETDRSKLLNIVNYRPIEFAQNILTSVQVIFTEISIIVLTIAAVLIYKPVLFLFLTVFLLPPVIISTYLIRKKLNHIKANISKDAEKTNQYLNESFAAYIESNIFIRKAFFADRHHQYQKNLSSHVSQLQIAQWIPGRLVEVFSILGLFGIIVCNKLFGNMSNLLDLGAFIAAAYKIMPGLVRISNASSILKTYQSVTTDLLAEKKGKNTDEFPSDKSKTIDTIQFKNVSFNYNGESILENLNVEIGKGDFLCISGPSGKGKTTFINLLLGFLAPQQGAILINNEEASPKIIREYYPGISYAKQQKLLIQDSVKTNITLEEDGIDEDRLRYAVDFAGLNPFINNLKNGIETIIADEGKDISGGQRQRITLARALYKNAHILILDEPFNELDKTSEQQILTKLKELTKPDKIVILITHNKPGPEFCNKYIDL